MSQMSRHNEALRAIIVLAIVAIAAAVAAASATPAPTHSVRNSGKEAGRYRVIFQGFTVNNQTKDNAGEVDGKGDEVFVNANIVYTDRAKTDLNSVFSTEDEFETPVFGDRNGYPNRVQAGSMPNCGVFGCSTPMGGLRTGDRFPDNPMSAPISATSPEGLTPPFVVWEGDLVQGDSAVAIMPSIWEWDGGRDAYNGWLAWAADAVSKIRSGVAGSVAGGGTAESVLNLAGLGIGLAQSFRAVLGGAQDRPIGDQSTWEESSRGQITFSPQVLKLNYDIAEAVIKNSIAGVSGLRAMTFKDNSELAGSYTLYFRIERVGDAHLAHDNDPPAAEVVRAILRPGGVQLTWRGIDPNIVRVDRTGVAGYDLAIQRGKGWAIVAYNTRRTTRFIPLKPGEQVSYRVRARDAAGNVGAWSPIRTSSR